MNDAEKVDLIARTLFVVDVPGIFTPEDWLSLSVEGQEEFRRIARALVAALSASSTPEETDA